jgi:hypothetical protein
MKTNVAGLPLQDVGRFLFDPSTTLDIIQRMNGRTKFANNAVPERAGMLNLCMESGGKDCGGTTRRDFLKVGVLGLGGFTLSQLLALRAHAATHGGFIKDKSIVLLFLGGGPSHIETFNPNLSAPSPFCSMTGEVQTSVPGMTFGGTFPQLAGMADRMAVVRSFAHPIGDHVKAIVHVLNGGENPASASMGSLCCRLLGANHPQTGMPRYALLSADEVDPQYRNERGRVGKGSAPGSLGLAYAPFDPGNGGPALSNMTLNISTERLDDRRRLLGSLDRIRRDADASGEMEGSDKFSQQAFDLILGGASQAFDLSREDPKLLARYDTSSFRVGKKVFQPSPLGKQMLLARRLCEAGCGFVTVQSAGWDMHADVNNPGIVSGMEMLGRPLDRAVSAFLEDVQQRGLSDKILLVITGDFGRTPKINNRGGRDHWANLCTLALAGGGLQMGQVIGRSSRKNDIPNSDPITPANLMGTIAHTLFDVSALRLRPEAPRDVLQVIERNPPIAELF